MKQNHSYIILLSCFCYYLYLYINLEVSTKRVLKIDTPNSN